MRFIKEVIHVVIANQVRSTSITIKTLIPLSGKRKLTVKIVKSTIILHLYIKDTCVLVFLVQFLDLQFHPGMSANFN